MPERLKRHGATLCWWSLALAVAWALKHHYSVATAAELGWMLRPVAGLVTLATGQPFSRGAGGEWVSADAGVVLVKACAGVNFLVMSFLGWCWLFAPEGAHAAVAGSTAPAWPRPRRVPPWWLRLAAALALAWGCALLTNAARIVAALAFGHALGTALGPGAAHRLIGLVIYLPALGAQLWLAGGAARGRALMAAAVLYAALMLVTPLVTGNAWQAPARYAAHALMLALALVPLWLWGLRLHRRRRQ